MSKLGQKLMFQRTALPPTSRLMWGMTMSPWYIYQPVNTMPLPVNTMPLPDWHAGHSDGSQFEWSLIPLWISDLVA
jgi:hypothetical protein